MAGDYAHAELIGVENFKELLKSMGNERLLGAARKELQRYLTRMRDDARKNAPYDPDGDGVHLRDTIHYKTNLLKRSLRGELIASSEHAVFVEMGTGPVGASHVGAANVSPQVLAQVTYHPKGWFFPTGEVDKKGRPKYAYTDGMAPRPYLYPAYKAYEGELMPAIRKAIAQAVESASAQTDGGTAE